MKKFILMLLTAIVPATLFAADYWRKIPVPSGKNLLAVSFGSPMTGYIGGTDSTLLKTVDGGATWTAIKPSGILFTATTPDIIDLEFVSATTGFAVISKRSNPELRGTIYKTTDGGLSWNEEAAPIACFRTFFFDDENGLALGSGFFSGKNVTRLKAGVWQSPKYLDYSPSFFLRAVDFFDLNTGIVGGDSGKVYRTFDGGITWDTVQANIDTAINGLMYLSADTIVGVSSNTGAAIIISTDKGKTWNFDLSSMTFFYPEMRAIARSAKDSVIMVGHSQTTGTGIVYYYGDMFMNIFTADKDLNDVTMANDSVAFIAGDSGLLLSNVHIATAIKEASLSQNTVRIFPNPAHDLFTVQTDVPCSVSVWDMQGRCLIIGGTTAREHHIDMSAYAAGVYFVEAKPENGPAFRGKISLQ